MDQVNGQPQAQPQAQPGLPASEQEILESRIRKDLSAQAPTPLALTLPQRQILSALLNQCVGVLINLRFTDEEKDQIRMRQHACVCGELDLIQRLLSYDENNNKEFEEEIRRRMAGGAIGREQTMLQEAETHTAF